MVTKHDVQSRGVSDDFRKQVLGYGLTTAEILYRRPDRQWLLQSYVWQNYDMFPKFPVLCDFLAFWEKQLDGPLVSVTVAHSRLIKPAELRAVDGVFGCIERRCSVIKSRRMFRDECARSLVLTLQRMSCRWREGACRKPGSFLTNGHRCRQSGSLLRHRPFVFYLVARTFSRFAIQVAAVAVGWQVYELTSSAFVLGMIGLVQFLPTAVLVFVAGHAVDRFDRRRVLQVSQIVQGLTAVFLAWGTSPAG